MYQNNHEFSPSFFFFNKKLKAKILCQYVKKTKKKEVLFILKFFQFFLFLFQSTNTKNCSNIHTFQ